MLLVSKPDFVLQSDRRVVKAADVATVRSAAEIVAAAEAEAARIREEAKEAFEDERSPCRSWTRSIPPLRSWKA